MKGFQFSERRPSKFNRVRYFISQIKNIRQTVSYGSASTKMNVFHPQTLKVTLTFFSLVCTTGASSASDLKCEIRASCSPSRDCHYSNQMTVAPDSNVTLNCSIGNGETTLGMTWKQVKERVKADAGLVLQEMNSTCRCTHIHFPSKLLFFFM